jgi:hypothetical protein
MISGQIINGSCLCRKVGYQITGNMGVFQYCHCSRCRKFTGSAYAANLFTAPGDFSWTRGEELVGRYDPADTKYFATCFCKSCGSSLPWLSKSKNVVVIPAGTLDEDPGIRPTQNIFCGSRPAWYTHVTELPEHDEMPPR